MDKFFSMTNQFKYCGNPFRIDTYEGCDFGCKYCFANNRGGAYSSKKQNSVIEYEYMKRFFDKAFESERKYKDITVEMLQHKVPLHLGGMADPFQKREFEHRMTYELLKLSNKYHYPIMISTKCGNLPQEYWDILNPEIHAFQISLISANEDYIRQYEINTPSPKERIRLIKTLHSKGFWVGLRIQPLIDLDEAINLIKEVEGCVNYITVEHLKIPTDNNVVKEIFKDIRENKPFYKPKKSRNYEFTTEYKLDNIKAIKQITKTPIGCADNDLHMYSDSRCCCGIDTVNKNFDNWLKYNTTYFETGEYNKDEIWTPQCNVKKCMHGDYQVKDMYLLTEYVEKYIKETNSK